MPTLEWIGKEKVINHHQNVPFRVLEYRYSYPDSVNACKRSRLVQNVNHVAPIALMTLRYNA